jgi:hypothetical protein
MNIIVGFKEIGSQGVGFNHLAQEKVLMVLS